MRRLDERRWFERSCEKSVAAQSYSAASLQILAIAD
jgi:hypothetical protein